MVGAEISPGNNGGSLTQPVFYSPKDESLLNQTTTVQESHGGAKSTAVSLSCGFQPHPSGPRDNIHILTEASRSSLSL